MGVVWTAIHLVTKRRVAIKLLRAGGHDAGSRARLLREARASCAVDHPNVLAVLDVIDADGAPALVMDLLEGESLRERLERQGALEVRVTCTLLAPVAGALAAAHAAGIVHRDIKPENIFLVGAPPAEPTVKVLDFGIAKIVATEEPSTNLTESGAMLGTPYYMSPEQAFGERNVGPATDAWALGVVLYECLTGARPTQADNLGQIIKRITQDPIAPVAERVAGVPAPLNALIARLLQRDVAAREVDMASVARTLASCAELATEERAAKATNLPVPATPANRKSRTRLFALAAMGVGAIASAIAWRSASTERPSASPSITTSIPISLVGTSAPTATPSAIVVHAPTLGSDDRPTGAASATSSSTSDASPHLATARSAADLRAPAAPASASAHANVPLPDDGGTTGPGRVIIKSPF